MEGLRGSKGEELESKQWEGSGCGGERSKFGIRRERERWGTGHGRRVVNIPITSNQQQDGPPRYAKLQI